MGVRMDGHDARQIEVSLWQRWQAKGMHSTLPRPRIEEMARRIVEQTPDPATAILAYIDMKLSERPQALAEQAEHELEVVGLRFRVGQLF